MTQPASKRLLTELNADMRFAAATPPRLLALGENGIGTMLLTTAAVVGTSEQMFMVGVAASGISVEYVHWYTNGDPMKDVDPAGPISFNASVKVGGVIYRLTFGGRTTATLDPGGKVTADVLGLDVAVGDVVAVRTFLVSGTAYIPRTTRSNAANGGFTTTTDLTAPGSAAIAAATSFSYGPSAVLGYPKVSSGIAVLLAGDSILRGAGDGIRGADGGYLPGFEHFSGGGFMLRALSGKAGVLSIARSSDKVGDFVAMEGHFRRMSLAARCNRAIIEYGINDLIAGASANAVQVNLLKAALRFQRFGIFRTFLCTLTPMTTSTDGWATVGNQTAFANNTARVTHNNWVRAGCPVDSATLAPVTVGTVGALLAGQVGHPIAGYFEVADAVESARDSGKWKAAGRVVTDAAITSAGFNLSSATAAFTSADKSSAFWLAGAGAAGVPLVDYFSNITNGTVGVTTTGASTTVSSAALNIGIKTTDGTHPSTDGHKLMAAAIDVARL